LQAYRPFTAFLKGGFETRLPLHFSLMISIHRPLKSLGKLRENSLALN
jgi:hypothetical protein